MKRSPALSHTASKSNGTLRRRTKGQAQRGLSPVSPLTCSYSRMPIPDCSCEGRGSARANLLPESIPVNFTLSRPRYPQSRRALRTRPKPTCLIFRGRLLQKVWGYLMLPCRRAAWSPSARAKPKNPACRDLNAIRKIDPDRPGPPNETAPREGPRRPPVFRAGDRQSSCEAVGPSGAKICWTSPAVEPRPGTAIVRARPGLQRGSCGKGGLAPWRRPVWRRQERCRLGACPPFSHPVASRENARPRQRMPTPDTRPIGQEVQPGTDDVRTTLRREKPHRTGGQAASGC